MLTTYYTSMTAVSCVALFVLSVLVHENGRLPSSTKKKFYLTYAAIALAALAEWGSVALNGAPENTIILHAFIKSLDYILTPAAGALFIRQVSLSKKNNLIISVVLMLNAALQLTSVFTGWTFYVDDANIYHHGPLYFIYVIIYCSAFVLVIADFFVYGKKYSRQNNLSLSLIGAFSFAGTVLQEFVSSQLRTAYVCLTIGSAFLYIFYIEYNQIMIDDDIQIQKKLLETDALTGLKSRYSYTEDIKGYNSSPLPDDLAVFSIDLNRLKAINDTFGHEAGDRMITDAARCVSDAFGDHGECYRTGGDEFVAIVRAPRELIPDLCSKLDRMAGSRYTDDGRQISFSYGYTFADEFPGTRIEHLIKEADKRMYEKKTEFYLVTGLSHERSRLE